MCIFCSAINGYGNIIIQEKSKYCSCFFDSYPVTKYHLIIIPNNHVETYFDLTKEEFNDIDDLLVKWKNKILEKDLSITGWNIGWNCGLSAGQTVNHAHCHLIPRRDNDIDDPTGGIRSVIPEKRIY